MEELNEIGQENQPIKDKHGGVHKKVLCWCFIVPLLVLYCFAAYVTLTDLIGGQSYEYNLYFRQKVTQFWAGENTMSLSIASTMNFDYSSTDVVYSTALVRDVDLQFVGRETECVVEADRLVYLTGDINLYWKWEDTVNATSQITLSLQFVEQVEDIYVVMNDQKVTSSWYDETLKLTLSYSNQNVLKIRNTGSTEHRLTAVSFSYTSD